MDGIKKAIEKAKEITKINWAYDGDCGAELKAEAIIEILEEIMIQSEKPRKVNILEQKRGVDGKVEFYTIGTGFFHGFCVETDGDDTACHAVIETPDGRVDTYWLKRIQFVEPLK